ncbi:hypothetical protein G9A89_016135 [Geosiphon pyriformis]|nr:hypothetical protein G9A89_016135 [Geosiphon pyriformis]
MLGKRFFITSNLKNFFFTLSRPIKTPTSYFHTSILVRTGKVLRGDRYNYPDLVETAKEPVIVDFYAEWCGPCKMLAPILEKAVTENQKVTLVKINVDKEVIIASRYNVGSLPTVIAFHKGVVGRVRHKMRITISNEAGELHNVEVDSQIELENVKALIEVEVWENGLVGVMLTGTPTSEQILAFNGNELTDPMKTLEQYGVIQDSILMLRRRPSNTRAPSPRGVHGGPEVEQMRQHILNQPALLQQLLQTQPELANSALNDPARFAVLIRQMEQRRQEAERQRMQQINILNADPFDIEAQRRIEEAIRQENVTANLEAALEYNPESFGRVTMLYIDAEVNGRPIKAFVDSGAQATIIDKRFAGIAKGVGTAKILGRVHSAHIRIGLDLFLACSFTIMEGRGVDLLFGLDMLKRHQACIDLRKNALIINGKEIPFLPEHELPEHARTDELTDEDIIAPPGSLGLINATNSSSSSSSSSSIAPSAARSISSNNPNSATSNLPSGKKTCPNFSNVWNKTSYIFNSKTPTGQSKYPEPDIQKLVSLGIPREEAIELLDLAGGNPDLAASIIFQ